MNPSSHHILLTKKNKFAWERNSEREDYEKYMWRSARESEASMTRYNRFLDVFQIPDQEDVHLEENGTLDLQLEQSLLQSASFVLPSRYGLNESMYVDSRSSGPAASQNGGSAPDPAAPQATGNFDSSSTLMLKKYLLKKRKKQGHVSKSNFSEQDFAQILEEYGMRKRKVEASQDSVTQFFQAIPMPRTTPPATPISASNYLQQGPIATSDFANTFSYPWPCGSPSYFEDSKFVHSSTMTRANLLQVIPRFVDRDQQSVFVRSTEKYLSLSARKELWQKICQEGIPKTQKIFSLRRGTSNGNAKRMVFHCSKEMQQIQKENASNSEARTIKKQLQEERQRKISEREEFHRKKREMEQREMERQQAKLNFLITQTELFSHFMQKKINPEDQNPEELFMNQLSEMHQRDNSNISPEEEALLRQNVVNNTLRAVTEARSHQLSFDEHLQNVRSEALVPGPLAQLSDKKSEDPTNNNKNRTADTESEFAPMMGITESLDTDMTNLVASPKMFKGTLKSYQIRGLSWLVNLYAKGINGILADEMGLGKTVQSMAFLAHLAEENDIWGPFIVIAPVSTVHNWQQEFRKFCPDFKVIPYWGSQKERTILRKFWNPKKLYRRESPFHVVVTSYNMFVIDEKYFHRIKWQYMILDEAQALKSSASNRWKTLLSFNCRNRLLLTGTPIQNSMAELWALLHFIMPTLFDSHEEFNEWFSKDIESHAQNQTSLNEHQLRRLHMILKPFMLRRIKKDVEQEIAPKVEQHVPCHLTPRQKKLYSGIKQQLSISDLLERTKKSGSDVLMNLVMQFRKVCNHPEIFQRSETESPFLFQELQPFYEHPRLISTVNHNPIKFALPRLLFDELVSARETHNLWLLKNLSVWNRLTVAHAVGQADVNLNVLATIASNQSPHSNLFSFSALHDMSPSELVELGTGGIYERWAENEARQEKLRRLLFVYDSTHPSSKTGARRDFIINMSFSHTNLQEMLHPEFSRQLQDWIRVARFFVRCAAAAPIMPNISSSRAAIQMQELFYSPQAKQLLFPASPVYSSVLEQDEESHEIYYFVDFEDNHAARGLKPTNLSASTGPGLLQGCYDLLGSTNEIWVPDYSRLLQSSGKLQTLDLLLRDLKKNGHRVLIYSQMTKMIDILEDFMWFRKYKYLRLDGQSKLSDRRDMVDDWQTKPELFVFLLSTRAGGLGINLTAADTVIFYDSDWNPTVDEQAMDRAHRLGQTKQVTVYRLVTSGTIEARILKRAEEKSTIQSLVISGSKAELQPNNQEVMSLLLEEGDFDPTLISEMPKLPEEYRNLSQPANLDFEAEGLLDNLEFEEEEPEPVQKRGRRGATGAGAPKRRGKKKSAKIF